MIVQCPKCGAKYRLDPAKFTGKNPKIKCKHCGEIFAVFDNVIDWEGAQPPSQISGKSEAPKAPSITSPGSAIVATPNEDLNKIVSEVLKAKGFQIKTIQDGVEALYSILNEKPKLVVVDVDLPRLYGFEVSELVRRNDPKKEIKIVLLGAIYNKDAYKRSPDYLYGADYYIDRHDVSTKLPEILGEAEQAQPSKAAQAVPEQQISPETQPKAPTDEIDLSQLSPEDQEWVKKAQRKARLIAADIALYNEEAIKEGLIHGDVYERIAKDLTAGREHYEKTIPEHIRKLKDFLSEEIEKMLENKRKELGL